MRQSNNVSISFLQEIVIFYIPLNRKQSVTFNWYYATLLINKLIWWNLCPSKSNVTVKDEWERHKQLCYIDAFHSHLDLNVGSVFWLFWLFDLAKMASSIILSHCTSERYKTIDSVPFFSLKKRLPSLISLRALFFFFIVGRSLQG